MTEHKKSETLYKKALTLMSGGVNSPVRAFKAVGGTPLYIDRGQGAYITDIDDNRYLDFCCSWGPLILGHAHPVIIKAIIDTAHKGTSFGTVHENEILLAEKIKQLCPHIDLLRFVSSGTEAVMSAIRLARGYTGRDKIIKFSGCYHGHSDYLLASSGSGLATFGIPSSGGVPNDFTEHTLVLPLDDRNGIEIAFDKYGGEIAAIIIEPIPANNGLLIQDRKFLKFLRDICSQNGALLVFDEVISGFRVAPGGASGMYDIIPDLCTYGKVVGGGLPVGAFGGKAEIMEMLAPNGQVYQAGTLSGNPLALACGYATLEFLDKNNGWKTIGESSKRFVESLRDITSDLPVNIVNVASIFWISLQSNSVGKAEDIDPGCSEKYINLFHKALESGIYLAPSAYEVGFISLSHSDPDLAEAAEKLGNILRSIF
jgi:glutamate-1-semialdehyde 2,1-aminomutase